MTGAELPRGIRHCETVRKIEPADVLADRPVASSAVAHVIVKKVEGECFEQSIIQLLDAIFSKVRTKPFERLDDAGWKRNIGSSAGMRKTFCLLQGSQHGQVVFELRQQIFPCRIAEIAGQREHQDPFDTFT